MSKKFGKILAACAVLGAAYGAFYYFTKKGNKADDFDDFDDFDDMEDIDDEDLKTDTDIALDDTITEEAAKEARDTIRKAVADIESEILDSKDGTKEAQASDAILKGTDNLTVSSFSFDKLDKTADIAVSEDDVETDAETEDAKA